MISIYIIYQLNLINNNFILISIYKIIIITINLMVDKILKKKKQILKKIKVYKIKKFATFNL